jgi:hypothetical protein
VTSPYDGSIVNGSRTYKVGVTANGTATSVLFWYDLHLYGNYHVHTSPPGFGDDSSRGDLGPALQYLTTNFVVSTGEAIKLTVHHNPTKIVFTATGAKQEGIPYFMTRLILKGLKQ